MEKSRYKASIRTTVFFATCTNKNCCRIRNCPPVFKEKYNACQKYNCAFMTLRDVSEMWYSCLQLCDGYNKSTWYVTRGVCGRSFCFTRLWKCVETSSFGQLDPCLSQCRRMAVSSDKPSIYNQKIGRCYFNHELKTTWINIGTSWTF